MYYMLTQKNRIYRTRQISVGSISLLLVIMWVTIATADDCQNDYSPCTCSYNVTSNYITCDVPMVEVATAFQAKPALDISSLTLFIRPEGDSIPADLLGQSRLFNLYIVGAEIGNPTLRVDPNAFRSSKNSLGSLKFSYLDTSRMDFDFLIDFPGISNMEFNYLLGLERSLPTLPTLPALTTLGFHYCSDLNKAFADSVLVCNGLTHLFIEGSFEGRKNMTDEGMTTLMNWLLPSSANTLYYIIFIGTSLTRTPIELGSFRKIQYTAILRNSINMTISTGSIFSEASADFHFDDSHVVNVEEGAFLGKYSISDLMLSGNLLTRFEAGAFKSVLDQIASTSAGNLDVLGNPFDCYSDPCHLAWLCRDNRHFFSHINGAQCNGFGELIEDMNPAYFTNCPEA